jgi:predicted MFS family arabinose efflux permease
MSQAQTAQRSLWADGNYVRYRTARVASSLGSQLSVIAYPLLVLSLGGHAVQAGTLASCSLFTGVACRIPGGHAADRFDRRKLMITMDLVSLIATATVPLAAWRGDLGYPQLLAVAVITSAAAAFFGPATTAFVREVAPPEQLARALVATQISKGLIAVIGPVAGGVLFEVNRILPFEFDAVSFGLSAALLLGVTAKLSHPGSADRRLTAGMRWVWQRPSVLTILLFLAVLNLVAAACQVLVIVALREHGAAASAVGAVMTCSGAGGISGALLSGRIVRRLDAARLSILVGLAWTAGFLLIAADFSPWLIGPVLAGQLFFLPACGIAMFQITVGTAPHDLLGRVSTAATIVSAGLTPAGPVLAGLSLQLLGTSRTSLALAAACLLATCGTAAPVIMTRKREQQPAPETAGAVPSRSGNG